ncbi:MAG: EAL domain-containing protein [Epsilonproteobacteria bacterium]|nr:EAL domain-containing protein [Campylobacterota bacterium]
MKQQELLNGTKEYFRNIDSLTMFLSILLGFIAILFIYTLQINIKEKEYKEYHDNLYKLEILDKSFDSFLLNQRKIINYNKIVFETDEFRNITNKLLKSKIYKEYGHDIYNSLIQIKKLFLRKTLLLQKFETYNASSVYTLISLLNLSNIIKQNDTLLYTDELVDDSLFGLIKIYLNFKMNDKRYSTKLAKLKNIKYRSNNLLLFYTIIKSATKKLRIITQIKKEAFKIPLSTKIIALHDSIDIRHTSIVKRQESITTYMFIFAFVLLIFLIYIYIKSIKITKELFSFKYAVQNSDDTIVITDKQKHITYINEAFTKSTGYSWDEAMGQNPSILKSGKMTEEFYINMNKTLSMGKKWDGEFINRAKNGSIFYERASITPIFTDKKLTGYLGIKLNITDYIKEQEKVKFLAYHDSLTHLPNRRLMKKIISKELANKKNRIVSLFFLDLDGFKNINDTLGHDIGDILLVELSKKLKNYMGKEDRVFRTGGDEFAILDYCDFEDRNKIIAENILKLANEPIFTHSHTLRVGISIGIARLNRNEDNIISLLKHADIAMYEAKQNGKNRYKFYTKKLSQIINKKMKVEQKLSNALTNGDLYVVYQPKYYLKTQKLRSIEALVRWRDDELGLVSPDYFIPIAEEMSLINKIGEFIFKKACEDFLIFNKKYLNLESVSINISPAQFLDSNLTKKLKAIINKVGIAPSNIGIEITETHLMQNMEENSKLLNGLKKLGCEIIIDDFGTGYSSLNYLKNLPISNLKIDKSFIDNICTDINDIKITKAIIGIANSFNYAIVAEGIETREQEEVLMDLGVKIGQGFLFSKPKTKEELLNFLDTFCRNVLD